MRRPCGRPLLRAAARDPRRRSSSETIASKRRSFGWPGSPGWGGSLAQRELGKELRQLRCCRAEAGSDALDVLPGEIVADRLDERQVGVLRLAGTTRKHRAPEAAAPAAPARSRASSSRSPLAGEDHETALPSLRLNQGFLEDRELIVPTDETRQRAVCATPPFSPTIRPPAAAPPRAPTPRFASRSRAGRCSGGRARARRASRRRHGHAAACGPSPGRRAAGGGPA